MSPAGLVQTSTELRGIHTVLQSRQEEEFVAPALVSVNDYVDIASETD